MIKQIFKKAYAIKIDYGMTTAIYFFNNMTKYEVLSYIVKNKLMGEACHSITFEEVLKGKDEVYFIGSLSNG
jgi:hypothetical protein